MHMNTNRYIYKEIDRAGDSYHLVIDTKSPALFNNHEH